MNDSAFGLQVAAPRGNYRKNKHYSSWLVTFFLRSRLTTMQPNLGKRAPASLDKTELPGINWGGSLAVEFLIFYEFEFFKLF